MPQVYPHTGLHIGADNAILISGPWISKVNLKTGEVEKTIEDGRTKQGPIRCFAVDNAYKYLVVTTEDKNMTVMSIGEGLRELSQRKLPKKPTEIRITNDSGYVLVSDKFGDVHRYPMRPPPFLSSSTLTAPRSETKHSALAVPHDDSGGTLVLGHTSLLAAFLLTPDEKYIITADRDEHIRVSWWPQGHVIERYCLGHTKFVSALHIPAFSHTTLISGGGDTFIQLWDWLSGTKIASVPIWDVVQPFIKVRPVKGRSWGDEDGEGEREKPRGKKARKRMVKEQRRKEQEQKEGGQAGEREEDGGEEEEEGEARNDGEGDTEDVAMPEASAHDATHDLPEDKEEPLMLVVGRIASMELPDGSRWILFRAVGATALFYLPFQEPWSAQPPTISTLDLGKPIVDFHIGADGQVWVLVDGEWADPTVLSHEGGSELTLVRLVGWANASDGSPQLIELPDKPPLLTKLNDPTFLKQATPADLKTLDLYSDLSTLPKNVGSELEPSDSTSLVPDLPLNPTLTATGKRGRKGKGREVEGLTQRELARLKNKQALVASMQGKDTGNEKREVESVGVGVDEGEDEREGKKLRSDAEEDVLQERMDES